MTEEEFNEWRVHGTINGETQEQAFIRIGRELAARAAEISRLKMQSATEALAWALGEMWMPVSNGLPEEGESILAVLCTKDTKCEPWVEAMTYESEKFLEPSGTCRGVKMTHWMPLPEPPKVK